MIELRPITRENVRQVCDLALGIEQSHLVAPAAFTVAEGHYEPGSILQAIYDGDQPAGVLLVETEAEIPRLVRFMIDVAHQRRGIGTRAVQLLATELREAGWDALETSYVQVAGGSEGFWQECGFVPAGREEHGEPVVRLELR
jgi:diamine N-acetyltransferase